VLSGMVLTDSEAPLSRSTLVVGHRISNSLQGPGKHCWRSGLSDYSAPPLGLSCKCLPFTHQTALQPTVAILIAFLCKPSSLVIRHCPCSPLLSLSFSFSSPLSSSLQRPSCPWPPSPPSSLTMARAAARPAWPERTRPSLSSPPSSAPPSRRYGFALALIFPHSLLLVGSCDQLSNFHPTHTVSTRPIVAANPRASWSARARRTSTSATRQWRVAACC
jgi:hypothetical protein